MSGHGVVGGSMQPALSDGQWLAANPFDRVPDRFDVVLLDPSGDASGVASGGTGGLVKRVVGLHGDRIEIVRSAADGRPRVQVLPAGTTRWLRVRAPAGEPVWRTGVECCAPDGRTASRSAPATVPPGRYFVLGDNPDASVDSRGFGFTAPGAVRAVVVGRLWPPGPLPDPGLGLEPAGPG
ncbi:MAG: signal peptidase I [Pseudonocardia sp.]